MLPVQNQRRLRHGGNGGFVLPLALTASFVALLGSASLHTLALHSRHRLQLISLQGKRQDRLRSAAQAFAQQAINQESCLLLWPSSEWHGLREHCLDADPARLQQGVVDGELWSLVDWTPSGDRGRLQLRLADGDNGAFGFTVDPAIPAVIKVGSLQAVVSTGVLVIGVARDLRP